MRTIRGPVDACSATMETSRLWRKHLLPEGSINYQGRKIDFTPARLRAMANAFGARAFDSVPLVFADAQNRHTMDPRQATGRVVDMEYVPGHGLDMLVRPDERGQRFLANNPDVGVSARILENYDRADGEHFDAAIQHALITWDPRVTGLEPWQVVGLSNDDSDVIDLSSFLLYPQNEPPAMALAAEMAAEDEAVDRILSRERQHATGPAVPTNQERADWVEQARRAMGI